MVTTYSDNLRIALQGIGDNNNTWGDIANNGIFQLLEDAIAGLVSINLTGTGDYTLSVANGSSDEARNMMLRLGGTPGAARNVIIPATSKMYLVECTVSAAVSITIKANSGEGVSCQPGQKFIMYCDGLNSYKLGQDLASFGITATVAELNILDGATLSTAELNILDGATLSVAELNVLDGMTATTEELNVLDGITASVSELNILDGATLSVEELNVLDGLTATTEELNVLDGITASTEELNILDGVLISAGNLNALQNVDFGLLPTALVKYQGGVIFKLGNISSVTGGSGTISGTWTVTFTSAYSSAGSYGVLLGNMTDGATIHVLNETASAFSVRWEAGNTPSNRGFTAAVFAVSAPVSVSVSA